MKKTWFNNQHISTFKSVIYFQKKTFVTDNIVELMKRVLFLELK